MSVIDLAFAAQVNRLLADHPASVTRWVTTPAHNRAVGGVPNSGHLSGNAVDLVFDSVSELYAAAAFSLTLGFTGVELDTTNNHLHVDTLSRTWQVVHHGAGIEEPLAPWLVAEAAKQA